MSPKGKKRITNMSYTRTLLHAIHSHWAVSRENAIALCGCEKNAEVCANTRALFSFPQRNALPNRAVAARQGRMAERGQGAPQCQK